MIGTIDRLVADKGYGFIATPGHKDFFFHRDDYQGDWTDLMAEVKAGIKVKVEFKDTNPQKGPRAQNVNKVGG